MKVNKKLNTIYIISKGRPWCTTAQTLIKINYPGEWFIVCGTNDETIPEYQKTWGKERILIFDWHEEVKTTDTLDNFGFDKMPSGATPVRNAVRRISESRGEIRHWQFDDDYTRFSKTNRDLTKNIKMTGKEFEIELSRLASFANKGKLANVGFCLGHEAFPATAIVNYSKRVFNAHNLPNDEKLFVKWRGRMNDDLINAIEVYQKGKIEMAFHWLNLTLKETQKEKGGLSDIYKNEGTVRKTAYVIMINPKGVRLSIKFGRYHHAVSWQKIVPKLLHEKHARV